MTISNEYYCYQCHHEIKSTDLAKTKTCTSCKELFHNKCWMGQCSAYVCQKSVKDRQISEDNWNTVKTTAFILFAGVAVQWLTKK
ncbi:MAG: hypothetical protein LLF94_10475 [Chlamydiales bacterium]|nr:hypothetical protein [Chlamydiales bacterium]